MKFYVLGDDVLSILYEKCRENRNLINLHANIAFDNEELTIKIIGSNYEIYDSFLDEALSVCISKNHIVKSFIFKQENIVKLLVARIVEKYSYLQFMKYTYQVKRSADYFGIEVCFGHTDTSSSSESISFGDYCEYLDYVNWQKTAIDDLPESLSLVVVELNMKVEKGELLEFSNTGKCLYFDAHICDGIDKAELTVNISCYKNICPTGLRPNLTLNIHKNGEYIGQGFVKYKNE